MDSQSPATANQQELEDFRKQWREEVQHRKVSQPSQETATSSTAPPTEPMPQGSASAKPPVESMASLSLQDPVAAKEMPFKAPERKSEITAMDHYVDAVENERQGKLGKALDSYRRAFKLDPDIDFVYKREFQQQQLASTSQTVQRRTSVQEDGHEAPDDTFRHIIPISNEYVAPSALRKDPLEGLIQQLSEEDLQYIPAVDYKPVLIAKLPSEIMQLILRRLILRSVSSIAKFAVVCKKFFLLTRSPSLWRFLCEHAFRIPGIAIEVSKQQQLEHVQKYGGHWMRMFIERPRIRFDGIYISTCHYIRPGTSDSSWNQPVHLVTYYRYLRFFPDGTLVKHVSTDEPAQVVKLINGNFGRKQVFNGRWQIDGDEIDIRMRDPDLPFEHFEMYLKIKSTHRGRHNKLTWIEYVSRKEGRDEIATYDLKLMKPFFFSTVRSYTINYTVLVSFQRANDHPIDLYIYNFFDGMVILQQSSFLYSDMVFSMLYESYDIQKFNAMPGLITNNQICTNAGGSTVTQTWYALFPCDSSLVMTGDYFPAKRALRVVEVVTAPFFFFFAFRLFPFSVCVALMSTSDQSFLLLKHAFYEHVEATIQLVRVALELEYTIFTRFTIGVIVATLFSVIYLGWTLRHSRRPLVVWEKLNKPLIKLFRPRMFASLLTNVNPYVGSIDMRVSTYSRGFCTGIMRDRHRNRDSFKSIHASALATFSETVGELALVSTLQDKDTATLKSLQIEYKKKARGLLTASSDFSLPSDLEQQQEIETLVVVKDRMLDTVAIAHLTWVINRKEV
ncbi:uncharacterized protein BYT42DRAFT_495985 [Radiomyces spectabilis]|uniref:uncharacterized protein n=1 Tax=Radiomyces spectabilis TaxID=64574 RepID=UPI002221118B|nr:uncharacterized protein BYT42DRAFT_495985 [Radiomyces spectabilis]KAI8379390.1 hypothetical protein BYT42DRAFT_495985 [Radiomyces spectabilis]